MSTTATARKPGKAGLRTASGLTLVLALTAACGATGPIASMAIDAGRRLLLDKAQDNFEGAYTQNFSRMLDLMMLRTVAPETAAEPGAQGPAADEPVTANYEPEETEPIELQVTVVREVVLDGRPFPAAVADGGVLRDGIGRDGPGDNLQIRFETNVTCYVYAVWVDATAWSTPIFPPAGAPHEPAEAGRTYTVPGGDEWFYLDDYRGIEHLYFVASLEPLDELADVLVSLAGQERSFRTDLERPMVAVVDEPGEYTRGLAGKRQSFVPVTASDGSQYEVATHSFIAQTGAGDLRVTRWFRHE